MNNLLEIIKLNVAYYKGGQTIPAVRGVDLTIKPGEIIGLVGESGCGKSTIALSIMRLIPPKQGKITAGQILFAGRDIVQMSENDCRDFRGNKIGMVFQEAFSSLNPVFRVGDQIKEAIKLHNPDFSNQKSKQRAIEALQLVNIPQPEERYEAYPHQLSGGMQQRAMLAMALACHPQLLIADEPTTALDVTIQAQILDLLVKFRKDLAMSILLITHNLAIVSQIADTVAIMYTGQIVELGPQEKIFAAPLHPYTVGLLNSVPDIAAKKERLVQITGQIPDPAELPKGCPFNPRCPEVKDSCKNIAPVLVEQEEQHFVQCWKYK
ncbi:MAG: ABC transporter ATP-binding protein [bacterium]|nr:ABC transporter ATP-binding protein [bacterium]MDD5756194.1 ABC transporter ATP-binding protein [bacterium]